MSVALSLQRAVPPSATHSPSVKTDPQKVVTPLGVFSYKVTSVSLLPLYDGPHRPTDEFNENTLAPEPIPRASPTGWLRGEGMRRLGFRPQNHVILTGCCTTFDLIFEWIHGSTWMRLFFSPRDVRTLVDTIRNSTTKSFFRLMRWYPWKNSVVPGGSYEHERHLMDCNPM